MSRTRFRVKPHSIVTWMSKPLARSRCEIWSLSDWNWTRIHNHLVHKRTIIYELSGSGFESSCNRITLFYLLSFVFIRFITPCHSLSLTVIFCYSLSFVVLLVVIRCHSLFHSLSFVVTRCTTRLPFYNDHLKMFCLSCLVVSCAYPFFIKRWNSIKTFVLHE